MIKLKVAAPSVVRTQIRLFTTDDLIDEEPDLRIPFGCPWKPDTSQVPLQSFEERHEIPDRKDMGTEEYLD